MSRKNLTKGSKRLYTPNRPCPTAREIVIIQDRAGDIYQPCCLVPDARTPLLIRARTNPLLADKSKLLEPLESHPLQGTYNLELAGDKRQTGSESNCHRSCSLAVIDHLASSHPCRCLSATNSHQDLPAGSYFSSEEQACMALQLPQLEGSTEKLKTSYMPSTLKGHIWVIARLGGWKGYQSERRPGITTFWFGLRRFNAVFAGFNLSRDVSRQ